MISLQEICTLKKLVYQFIIKFFYFNVSLVIPNHANLVVAECTFDRDSCSWRNTSTGDFEWRMATLNRRPSNLPDKTFGAPVGYAYFDIFNSGSRYEEID